MSLPYRPNVCLIIINSDKKIFIGERLGEDNHWQLPQGGIEEGSVFDNALREAAEELGAELNKFRVIRTLEAIHEYDFRNPPPYAKDRFRGQRQNFVVLYFTGNEQDINLAGPEAEFQSYRWCTRAEVLNLTYKLRRPAYEMAFKELNEEEAI